MLILVRHGKTFEPQQQAVWIGSEADPDLTAEGQQQAQALGQGLRALGPHVTAVQASPMLRTSHHAQLVLESMAARPLQHVAHVEALRELHYGTWAGRSRQDIVADGHLQALEAWERQGLYPQGAQFAPPQPHKEQALRGWLDDMAARLTGHSVALAVTHGGVLRLLGAMVQAPSAAPMKMACGHVGLLRREAHRWRALAWNVPPDDSVAKILAAHGAPI